MTIKKTAGLLTQHGKVAIVGPVLATDANLHVERVDGFDTDDLGTFSGEVERTLSPLECATKKAALACELSHHEIGLGSEGSFGEGPYGAFVPWHSELLVCIHPTEQWHVAGFAQGPSCHQHKHCQTWEEALAFYNRKAAGQALIIRPDNQFSSTLFKGISNLSEFRAAFEQCAHLSDTTVKVEYDLRAHFCPDRQDMIVEAAKDLAQKLNTKCPKCNTPGFWQENAETGLPCRWCHTPTHQIKSKIAVCQTCNHQEKTQLENATADPAHCPVCNP